MGDHLLMMAIPSEALWGEELYYRDENGKKKPLFTSKRVTIAEHKKALEEHPDAFRVLTLEVLENEMWSLTPEPMNDLDWHKDPKRRKRQTELNRKSLEKFINGKLRSLDGMMRSGWWVLSQTRARVTVMRGVKPGPMESFFTKPKAPKKKKGDKARKRSP